MSRKLLLALAFALLSSTAGAQTCPTRPIGDSTNACASTAFVTRAVTLAGVQSLNGLTGFLTLAAGSGITVTPTGASTITITDTATIVGGTGISATRVGAQFQVTNTGVTSINSQTGAISVAGGVTTSGATIKLDPTYLNVYSNCSFVATANGNALSVSLRDASGAQPSSTSPCAINFRNTVVTSTGYTALAVTAPNQFVTGTSGSTFGTSANVPFRIWVTAHNNAGSVQLGLSTRSASNRFFALDPSVVQNTTACNACTNATVAGTFYTTSALTSKPLAILGYLDWSAGLGTPGLWTTPTGATAFTRDMKKPGETVQYITAFSQAAATTASASYATLAGSPITLAITPTNRINQIKVRLTGTMTTSANSVAEMRIFRTSTQVGQAITFQTPGSGTAVPAYMWGLDRVSTDVGVTYGFQGLNSSGTLSFPAGSDGVTMELEEIQG